MISVIFQGKPFNITVIQVYSPTSIAEEAEVELSYDYLQALVELTAPKDLFFFIGDSNAKVRSQEIPGVIGKFSLGVQNEAGQRLLEFCQENTLVIANTLFNNTREDSTHGDHQMVNTEIRLFILIATKDEDTLYGQRKQAPELTMAQIISSLLQNSDLH